VNIAALTDSGHKRLLESRKIQLKKRETLCKIINCSNFFGKLKLQRT